MPEKDKDCSNTPFLNFCFISDFSKGLILPSVMVFFFFFSLKTDALKMSGILISVKIRDILVEIIGA